MPHTLPDPLLSRLSEFLAARIGLHFPKKRWNDLERGLLAAARDSGVAEIEAYARQLLVEPLDRQIEILASHLTVGETYFFRDGKSFDALEQYVLPELINSRRDSEKRLRIWCAGCCTGEEPYSVAMLLDRLLPAREQWNITLLATDINPQFLRKGVKGVYGEWSFRDTPAWVKERYFTRCGEGRFEIHPRIKKMVTFSLLNLADDVYPSLSNNTNAMDLIFCRNVLIYFTSAWAEKVVGSLYRALVDDGWLLVSPAEASNTLLAQFAPSNFSGAPLYRKAAPDASLFMDTPNSRRSNIPAGRLPQSPAPWETIPEAKPIPALGEKSSFLPPPETPQPVTTAPMVNRETPEPDRAEALCVTARLYANQGKLVEAANWCEQAIATNKLDPHSHYLLANIRQELGQTDAAEQSLKRALYLDPDFVLAYFTLGNLRLTQGRDEEAKQYFGNAVALLQQHPFHETIAESDGLTAGRLNEIILSVLDSLPSAAAMRDRKGAAHDNRRANHA